VSRTFARRCPTHIYLRRDADLVTCRDEDGELWEDYDTLVEVIKATVAWQTWDLAGGTGVVEGGTFGSAKVLVVSQSGRVHRQIRLFLARLREIAAEQDVKEGPPRRARPSRGFRPPYPPLPVGDAGLRPAPAI
jgi:hypothetical protein